MERHAAAAVIQVVWPEVAVTAAQRALDLGATVTRPTPVTVLATWGTQRSTNSAVLEGRELLERHGDEVQRCGVLAAAVERGPAGVRALPGDVTFAVCEPTYAVVARSCAGLGQWYVGSLPNAVVAASHLALVEQLLDTEFAPDPLVLATWASGIRAFPWGRSPLRNVRVLPAGHFTELRVRNEPVFVQYWNPAEIPQGQQSATGAHPTELRASVGRAVSTAVAPDQRIVTVADNGVGAIIVGKLVGQRTAHVAALPVDEALDPQTQLDAVLGAPRTRLPVSQPGLVHAFRHARDWGAACVVTGEGAGELFGSPETLASEWVASLSASALKTAVADVDARERKALASAWTRVHRPKLTARTSPLDHLATTLAPIMRVEFRDEFDQWSHEVRQRVLALPHRRPALFWRLEADNGWLSERWELAAAAGTAVSLAFYSRELIELSVACHPLDLALPAGRLLYRAFGHLLPRSQSNVMLQLLASPPVPRAASGVPARAANAGPFVSSVASPLLEMLLDPAVCRADRLPLDVALPCAAVAVSGQRSPIVGSGALRAQLV